MLTHGKNKAAVIRMVTMWRAELVTVYTVPGQASQQAQNFMQKSSRKAKSIVGKKRRERAGLMRVTGRME